MKHNLSYQPLILNWENYLQSTNAPSLQGFAKYLLRSQIEMIDDNNKVIIESNTLPENTPYLTAEAAELIFRLNKYIKNYGKPVLQEMGISSMDEFVILAFLLQKRECSKKEIINRNLIEFTTGMDMLRRMIKRGLLIERINTQDKRQKIISLSKKGKNVLFEILVKFKNITDVLGDLDKKEREIFLNLLKQLNKFHTSVLKN